MEPLDLDSSVLLNVPYYNQLDNYSVLHRDGSRQCNLTSHTMALEYITNGYVSTRAKETGHSEPEGWYGYNLHRYGDTTDNSAHTLCIEKILLLENQFKNDGCLDDLKRLLHDNKPVPIGVHYKSSGHWVCVIGWDQKRRAFIVHDPYGVRAGAEDYYLQIGEDWGKSDIYSESLMRTVWCGPNEDDGWYREIGESLKQC